MSARLAGWGNFPTVTVARRPGFRTDGEAAAVLPAAPSLIARGNGRSYGDAALNPDCTLSTLRHDRLLAFDPETGRLTCEAGLLLAEVIDLFLPRGWFPPVTPGTKLVTIGGMVACDVHGKNHHGAGSFGRHVERLRLMAADGTVHTCSATENPALLRATIGGMGLTGLILDVTFRLMRVDSAWIRQETVVCPDLDSAMAAFEDAAGWTYSVAWIDCLKRGKGTGRALLYRGEHATATEAAGAGADPLALPARRPLAVPLPLPSFTLNPLTVRAFNEIYFRRGAAAPRQMLVDADSYFYPLDGLHGWNRIYGRRGFIQYQCVLPKAEGAAMARLLERIAGAGLGSFLAVLKLFGRDDGDRAGLLSFPLEGWTLALDFPASTAALGLAAELDRLVADHGGRLYLAKDARMGAGLLARGYPHLADFRAIRAETGADTRFHSLLSERLGL